MSECSKVMVDQVSKLLGVRLPSCAIITATDEGGIHASRTFDLVGLMSQVDITRQGEVLESQRICHFRSNGFDTVMGFLTCSDMGHRKLGLSVSPEKLARARKLILASQPKTPKADKKSAQAPTNQPAIARQDAVPDSTKTEKADK